MTLTLEDAKTWKMRESAHLNGGREWFGYIHTCIEQPRLSRFDKYLRKTKSVESTWRVDGEDAASLKEAIERLNTPPVFSEAELEVLRRVPDEYADLRRSADFPAIYFLRQKGAVEAEAGKCRRTDLGRDALRARA